MIRRQVRISLAVVVLTLSACGHVPDKPAAPSAEADAKAIGDTLDIYISAWKASDAGRIAGLYSDDAVILPGDHPAETGHTAIVKYNQDFFDQYMPGGFTISTHDRQIIGDWAFDSGSYTFSATPKAGGKPISDRGKYVVIMRRQPDGSWKWYRDIDNSDGPETPGAAAGKS
jgi:uncharacterized protein (TIGR02246 family)